MAARSGTSGRWLQPPGWAAPWTRAATAPFRVLQRPLRDTNLGVGFVLHARKAPA